MFEPPQTRNSLILSEKQAKMQADMDSLTEQQSAEIQQLDCVAEGTQFPDRIREISEKYAARRQVCMEVFQNCVARFQDFV